jgi:ribosome-associated protein
VKSIEKVHKSIVLCESSMLTGIQISKAFYIPACELDVTTSLSGGKGGQHVNKTNTKVTLRWNVHQSVVLTPNQRQLLLKNLRLTQVGDLVIQSDEHRSQRQNIQNALEKCKNIIEKALFVPKKRKPTKPTKSSQRKRIEKKKRRSETKQNRRKPDGF